jgi:hypothetical protein
MNYFLIANNTKLSESTIYKLNLNIDIDVLVLFNFLIPLKFNNIKYYPNKFCISRKRPKLSRQISKIDSNLQEFYCNMSDIKNNESLFKQIYFIPCPDDIEQDSISYKENIEAFSFDTSKLKCFHYNLHDLRNKLKYPGIYTRYEVSTGIIAYDFLKQENPYNKIILVGFTSELSMFHEAEWEKNYFLNELYSKNCYAIDSYGFTNYP